jgi:hypothetical protein
VRDNTQSQVHWITREKGWNTSTAQPIPIVSQVYEKGRRKSKKGLSKKRFRKGRS